MILPLVFGAVNDGTTLNTKAIHDPKDPHLVIRL